MQDIIHSFFYRVGYGWTTKRLAKAQRKGGAIGLARKALEIRRKNKAATSDFSAGCLDATSDYLSLEGIS